MPVRFPGRALCAAALLLLQVTVASGVPGPTGTLDWRADRNRVDAQVDGWPLSLLLEEIASATGWEVYVQPNTTYEVTTEFDDLTQADALRRLLGRLNFSLLPQPKGPSQLFVYSSSVEEATQRIRAVRAKAERVPGQPIPSERIVVLEPGADIDALARRLGAKVVGRMDGRNAYRLAFADAGHAQRATSGLEDDPAVDFVENNSTIAPPAVIQPLATGGTAAPALLRPDVSPSADSVIVGLIDSAVQPDPRFEGFLQPGVSVFGEYQPSGGPMTHGTAMAATILDGVARALREGNRESAEVALQILPVDVYGANDTTTTFELAQGLVEALGRHVNIVNLSLASENDSQLVRTLIQDAVKKGVVFVGAAGNEGGTAPVYPAADPGVISVTAFDKPGDGIASYANRGAWIDAIAPGSNVITFRDQSWWGQGTSIATSWVSGWAAGTMAAAGRGTAFAQRQTMSRWKIDGAGAR